MLNLDSVKKDFICPITRKIMLDPVIDSLGEVYEREAIENWFNTCKQNNQPLTAWNSQETQEDGRLTPVKKLRTNEITPFLEEHPEYWSEVYLSKKLCDEFVIAFEKKEKQKLAELIKIEPRFLTFNNCELISWAIKENDLSFLKDVVILNLSHRGQKKYFFNVLASCAEAKWIEGMRLLIASEKWGETHFQQCIIKWIQENKLQAIKALLHEMQSQKFNVNAVDENGNTFIHVAIVAGHAELVALLLAMGVDGTAKNGEGLSAEALAAKNNHLAVVEAFKKFHASGQQASGSNLQIQMLQNEVQELKYQIADLKAQTKQIYDYSKIAVCVGVPFFANLKKKAVKHGFFLEKPTHTFKAEEEIVGLVSLPNEQVLTVGIKGKLAVWDINEGSCVKTKLIETNGKNIAVCVSRVDCGYQQKLFDVLDGQFTFWTVNINPYSLESIQTWDIPSLTCINKINEKSLANYYTKNLQAQIKISGNSFQIISTQNAKSALICTGHKGEAIKINQLSNGNLISCSKDKTLKIWNIESGECITTLNGHSDEITMAVELPNKQIASITDNGKGIIWDISAKAEDKCIKKFSISGTSPTAAVKAITEEILGIRYGYKSSSDTTFYPILYDLNIGKTVFSISPGHRIDKLANGMIMLTPDNPQADKSGIKLLEKINNQWENIQTFAKDDSIRHSVVLDDFRVVTASGTTLKVWDNPVRRQMMQAEKEIANIMPGCRVQ